MTDLDWKLLSQKGQLSARSHLTTQDTRSSIISEVRKIQKSIETIRYALLVEGLIETDAYHETARESRFNSEETTIAPRVRLDKRYGTPSFYWERTLRHAYPLVLSKQQNKPKVPRTYYAYVRRKRTKIKEKMKVVLVSKHIPINKKTLSVSMNEFENEPQWARTAALIMEPKLVNLRRISKAVSHVNRFLGLLNKLLQDKRV